MRQLLLLPWLEQEAPTQRQRRQQKLLLQTVAAVLVVPLT